jgi:hypothetical protein
MIYCSLEPGLLSLKGLEPHDTATAFAVINALFLHRDMLRKSKALVPVTDEFIKVILDGLNNVPIQNPPIQRTLKEFIIEALSRRVKPSLIPTGVEDVAIEPDIVSAWISSDLRKMWVDCIVAAIAEYPTINNATSDDAILTLATWLCNKWPLDIELTSENLCTVLDRESTCWTIPLLIGEHDWKIALAKTSSWIENLEILVEEHARRYLGIPLANISERRAFQIEQPCYHDICKESDPNLRASIIEVMACRAYDHLLPHHHNETIKGQKGMWRVYVKKMAPSVRLHYYLEDSTIFYTLYSNNEHDKGL